MPTCREMAELVTDYLEHALPLRIRFSAWVHLLRCTACLHYFAQARQTASLLRQGQPAGTRPTGTRLADEEAILQRLRDQKLRSR